MPLNLVLNYLIFSSAVNTETDEYTVDVSEKNLLSTGMTVLAL